MSTTPSLDDPATGEMWVDDSQPIDYTPGSARMGDPTPQTHPDLFTTEQITAEIRYLMRLNRRHGSHPLRTLAYITLAEIRAQRSDWQP